MLKPSYAELMDVLNKNSEGEIINSRYTVVIAAAKRARQLIDGDEPMIDKYNEGKPVSTAVEELYEGKIQIVGEGEGTVLHLHRDIEQEVKEELAGIKDENAEAADNEADTEQTDVTDDEENISDEADGTDSDDVTDDDNEKMGNI